MKHATKMILRHQNYANNCIIYEWVPKKCFGEMILGELLPKKKSFRKVGVMDETRYILFTGHFVFPAPLRFPSPNG